MNLHTELESLPAHELIGTLSIRIYEPPLCEARKRLREIAEPLRVLFLVLDFDTEVCMNGMLGFLENSTGVYLAETIDAFDSIGARETAAILRDIKQTMLKHGVSPAKLRADFAGTEAYEITTFRKLHGDLGSLPVEIEHDAMRLYVNGKAGSGEEVWSLLETYIQQNRQEFFAALTRVTAE